MSNFKTLLVVIAMTVGFSGMAVGAENSSQTNQSHSEEAVKGKTSTKKKSRRKKVLMCAECGKPETQCDCDHHGEEGEHEDK